MVRAEDSATPQQTMRRPPLDRPSLRFGLGLLWGVGLLVTLTGCPQREAALPEPDHVYDSQGVIYDVAHREGRWPEVTLYHQTIPEFVGRGGEITGMASMAMPFTVAPDVSLEGFEEGDAVAFRFEVRWEGDPTLLVTSLERLPPGTVIDFSPDQPAEPVPEAIEIPEPESAGPGSAEPESAEPEPAEEG